MENLPETRVDLVEDSKTHLLTVTFSKNSSPNYKLAVNVAMGATKYQEIEMGKSIAHLVAFAKNTADASRAMALLHYISGWKATQVYAGGKMFQNYYDTVSVLQCYLEAAACNDYKAHCFSIINDPYSKYPKAYGTSFSLNISLGPKEEKEEIFADRYIFPCKKLEGFFNFKTDHPSTLHDQIQAKAIEHGCDWCPFFDQTKFKKTGTQAKVVP